MEFGKTLREAREAKGYTLAQLGEITHIMPGTIEGLENENFHDIPAPIYGRGFVKLCCQALGLDPKPMIDAFMSILNGETAAAPAAPAPAPAPAPDPVVAPEPTPVVAPTPAPAPAPAPIVEKPVDDDRRFGGLFDPPPPETEPSVSEPVRPAPSRFAPPRPQDDDRRLPFSLPPIPWRLVGLLIAALAALWLAAIGCRAVYRSLSTPSPEPAKSVAAVQPTKSAATDKKSPAPAAAKTPRKAKNVKPLYID